MKAKKPTELQLLKKEIEVYKAIAINLLVVLDHNKITVPIKILDIIKTIMGKGNGQKH